MQPVLCCCLLLAAIELQSASIPASSLAAPFFTSSGALLDLDAITVTDLHSSNSTRLLASLSASAAQPPIRLQPNKPRVLRHQQLLCFGKQRARFVLRQYEQGVQRAKQHSSSPHTSPIIGDPNDATQAYYATEEEKNEANLPMHDQATIAYVDDDIDEPPQSARHHSAYDDSSDDEQQNTVDANITQVHPAAAEGAEEEEKTEVKHDDDDPAVDLSYEVELDLVEDEQAKDREEAKPTSQPVGLRGEGSETPPIIMSFASSHSSNGNNDVQDQQPLSALAHSHSNPTDAAGSKKASARTRVKQPSMVVTAEEQRSSMEEEGREHSRRAEQEKEKKLRQDAEEQKAAFEREVQAKARQREEKRREEEAEEKKQEEEQRKQREQQEADRRRQAQQEENERVKREAKERREADKRERERREREQEEEEEEERERQTQENERRAHEEKKNAEEERKRAEEAAAAAEEEAKRRSEAEEAERVERMKQEDEERQRQLMAAEKQRLQQMAVSQLGWKSKPSKKGPAQPTNKTSPSSKKANNNQTTSPRGKKQAKTDDSKQEGLPVEQQKAHDEKEVSVSEQKVEEEKKETKSRRGKRKSAGEADEQSPAGSEQKKRASRRQTAAAGRVIPIPITQPAEEQWDGAEFSPAVAEVHRADVEMEQERGEKRMEEEKSEVEPENPMVTTAEEAEQTERTKRVDMQQNASTEVERASSRGKRKREDKLREEKGETKQKMDESHTDVTPLSTSTHQLQPIGLAADAEADGHLANSAESDARPISRKQGRRPRKEANVSAAHDSSKAHATEVTDSAEEAAVDQQPSPLKSDSSHLSTRSTATLAAMDVLEDMDVAQALATDNSMATTDEEVSPANTAVTPKRKRGRPRKKPVASKVAGEKEMELEAAAESSSEGKRTAKRGKGEVDTSIAEENPITDHRGTRYSHRTRSAGNVDDETPAVRTSSSASTPTHATRRTGSKSTTPSSSTVHTRSTSSSPSASSDPTSPAPVLLFTAMDHTSYNADIDRLHGTVTTDPLLATHLITNKVRRTDKFLTAYSVTPHLQSLQWLERCVRSGRWGEEEGGRLVDEEAEGKWGFVLSERRVRSGWMAGWQVWCSDSVVPGRASMKGIVEAAGGQMREAAVEAKKARSEEKVLIIGCEEDKAACMEWTRAGHTVYDKVSTSTRLSCHSPFSCKRTAVTQSQVCLFVLFQEILLTGVLRQRVELDQHILYQPTAASAGKPSAKGRKR